MHSFQGYRTCYYRTLNIGSARPVERDAYKRARDAIDRAIAEVRPGASSADIVAAFPTAEDIGFTNEEEAFGLQYCHGIGLSVWEKPLMSRYHSFDHPIEIQEGMVFALETYWPTADGRSAARIEEEVVVEADGARIITRFPADELLVTGTRYWNGFDFSSDTKAHNGAGANGQAHAETTGREPIMPGSEAPVLEARSLSRNFGGIHALQDVSLAIRPGRVHALLGENGAGKSTLVNIFSGALAPSSGSVAMDGVNLKFDSPARARDLGIRTIHQELELAPSLDRAGKPVAGLPSGKDRAGSCPRGARARR